MGYVHPKQVCVVGHDGDRIRLHPRQTWDDNDPFVQTHPDLFADEPVLVSRSQPPIEQATAAPGEKRATRRPRTSEADKPGADTR